ncbi:MAG: hypothetical protein NTZ74_09115 [Chloroflexi bacterium]|nr:hypothetical protein [Chloroflexota bacterium]
MGKRGIEATIKKYGQEQGTEKGYQQIYSPTRSVIVLVGKNKMGGSRHVAVRVRSFSFLVKKILISISMGVIWT